ncbi:MAG: NADH-quinone oxidoreductase subunit J [Bdellovibrionaceae bacterium]|nr:NADH-quinone oxidoreductase subunit J [Bdellovibrionales bacterium]MCB9253088.1 NADH-quinone oxidoreductase subunit J [Pseudobdellovibrionaceae bacterium]
MREVFFMIFSVFTVLAALGVVVSRHAIFSAFSLVLSFFGLAVLYLLWGSSFVAMLQILIYTGAIVVLFVFVVMLLDLKKEETLDSAKTGPLVLAGVSVWLFSLLVLRALNRATFFKSTNIEAASDMKSISTLLFSKYLWGFEILSVFLLALIVSACVLARAEHMERKADQ